MELHFISGSSGSPTVVNELFTFCGRALWPATVVIVAIIFRPEIISLLKRIKSASALGVDFELADDVQRIEELSKEVPKSNPVSPKASGGPVEPAAAAQSVIIPQYVLDAARISPHLGIMAVSRELEVEVRRHLAATGWINQIARPSSPGMRQMSQVLFKNRAIPEALRESIELFSRVRNQVAHGVPETPASSLYHIVDVGLEVLRGLKALPLEIHTVDSVVQVYNDERCQRPIDGVKGLILIATGIAEKPARRIYATTHPERYTKGMRVAWEWNMNTVFENAYYLEDGKPELAWGTSAEFVGRDLDAV